jgi:hypothetical protein
LWFVVEYGDGLQHRNEVERLKEKDHQLPRRHLAGFVVAWLANRRLISEDVITGIEHFMGGISAELSPV